MSSILEKIIANKKLQVESGYYRIEDNHLISSTRSLYQSLLSKKPGLILECKAASPSKGVIVSDYQPQKLAKIYQTFAAAISVLTDEKYFNGAMSHLKQVSESTDLPVLCKDFFISKEQILSARKHGADAILLMLSVLDDEQYSRLATQAKLLDLDVLTEVHNEEEMERAIGLGAKIIGVNNRNLGTLEIDMQTTARLADKVPTSSLLISESGYSTREQLLQAFKGTTTPDGFLVGSYLSAAKNTSLALRELIFGKVKICGLTAVKDAQHAFQAGAIYGGLIFAENSPRKVNLMKAKVLVTSVPLNWVGVFTETDNHIIVALAEELRLTAVQLHFNIDIAQRDQLRQLLPKECQIWQLIRVDESPIKLQSKLLETGSVQRYLIEPEGKLAGGNGQQFNWSILKNPNLDHSKLILAGGVNPENILEASAYGTSIIDVNSGVELSPGKKSTKKISQLFKQLIPNQNR